MCSEIAGTEKKKNAGTPGQVIAPGPPQEWGRSAGLILLLRGKWCVAGDGHTYPTTSTSTTAVPTGGRNCVDITLECAAAFMTFELESRAGRCVAITAVHKMMR